MLYQPLGMLLSPDNRAAFNSLLPLSRGLVGVSSAFLTMNSHQQHDSVPLVIASERIDY